MPEIISIFIRTYHSGETETLQPDAINQLDAVMALVRVVSLNHDEPTYTEGVDLFVVKSLLI
jgi:hypothetical protein